MMQTITLGTRASALALAQAELTRQSLGRHFPALVVLEERFTTQGDRKLDLELLQRTPSGGKGLFTKELEDALFAGRIDVAVHSLKDLPGRMPEGLKLAAVLPGASTADLLISKHGGGMDGLPPGARVGTSSVRRARQLTWLRPDLRVAEWRGNVQTRLRKLGGQEAFDAIVLAQAGLDRLGFSTEAGKIEFEEFVFHTASLEGRMYPAIGQGVIALQSLSEAPSVREILGALNDGATWLRVLAERELQRLLGGDCTLPVGVRTCLDGPGVRMEAVLFTDGTEEPRFAWGEGGDPLEVAGMVAAQLSQ